MKRDLILACLVLAGGLGQPVLARAEVSSLERQKQGPAAGPDSPASLAGAGSAVAAPVPQAEPVTAALALHLQEEQDDAAPAQDPDEPGVSDESGEEGRTTAGASVSSSGTGVGITSRRDKFFFGGGVGLGFGDIKYVEIWPLFGYNFNPKVRGGMTLLYRYRKDDRVPDTTSTTDYGGSLFVDYFPVSRFFLHGEYEYLSYEFINFDLTADREGFNSVFGGVGFANPISANGFLNIMVLYNFSHDSNDFRSPYADPYVIRIGVSFGF